MFAAVRDLDTVGNGSDFHHLRQTHIHLVTSPICRISECVTGTPLAHPTRALYTRVSRPVGDFPVVAFSLASELELAGVVACLDLAGIPALALHHQGCDGTAVAKTPPIQLVRPLAHHPTENVVLPGAVVGRDGGRALVARMFAAVLDLDTVGSGNYFHHLRQTYIHLVTSPICRISEYVTGTPLAHFTSAKRCNHQVPARKMALQGA